MTLYLIRRNMVRTFFTAVLASSVVGTLIGIGIAYYCLSVNAWQAESETKSYESLFEVARQHAVNPNAKAHIEATTHYFGVMNVKATGTHDFFIKNVGTEDLILVVDRTTCSCTGIDITPTRVAPGKTAKCHLKYNAEQALTGKFSQGGVVRTNDPDNREIMLIVEGVFTNPVVVQPPTINFSRVSAGMSKTITLRFYGFEDEPLQLSAPVWTDRTHFDFQWAPPENTESNPTDSNFLSLAKSVIEGTITLKPGLPVGSFQEWFQVNTNYPSQASVSFSASGQIVGGNVAISGQGYNPATGIADLGRTVTGRGISRQISIRFSGTAAQSASVQVKEAVPTWLRTELPPPSDAGSSRIFSLVIEVPEDAPTGSYAVSGDGQQAYVLLETNDEAMPVVRIPLQFAIVRQ